MMHSHMKLESAHHLLQNGLYEGLFTGAALVIRRGGDILFSEPYGALGGPGTARVTSQTLFDLASLTKVLATTPSWLLLSGGDRGILDRPLSHWLPECPADKACITPRLLLAHASGLPAWRPYYLMRFAGDTLRQVCLRILDERLDYVTARGCLYSDLGFMLLGLILELETGLPLARLCEDRVYSPLGLGSDLMFKPFGQEERTALTRYGDPVGLVNDLNARALGGISGHAGLFGTSHAVSALGAEILQSLRSRRGIFDQDRTREFCRRVDFLEGCTRALGFDTPSEESSSSGRLFSHRSIGHTGFTGTSLWVDLERQITVVLLTNRVIMGEADQRIKVFRPRLHDAVMECRAATRSGDRTVRYLCEPAWPLLLQRLRNRRSCPWKGHSSPVRKCLRR
jgi:CubicO group peptidase (beta-lactamase class C family)